MPWRKSIVRSTEKGSTRYEKVGEPQGPLRTMKSAISRNGGAWETFSHKLVREETEKRKCREDRDATKYADSLRISSE